jgi:large subunit ribosomal protein L23
MKLNNIIQNPVITESTLALQELGKYTFYVDRQANKDQIVLAFEEMFGIKPLAINTLISKGKEKTNWKNRKTYRKTDKKKAIISIPKDKKIELLNLKTK